MREGKLKAVQMLAGQLLCELANFMLKQAISEAGPLGIFLGSPFFSVVAVRNSCRGYGIQSSQAQFMAFFTAYVTLCLIYRFPHSKRKCPTVERPRIHDGFSE